MPATEWCQRYLPRYLFSVSNPVCLSSVYRSPGSPALRRTIGFNTRYRTSSDASEIWVSTFPVRSVRPRGKTELILTVIMETRHPVEGQFGSEFRAICNHCGVMAAWSRITWTFCQQFLRFLKRPLTVKFSKLCSESFHRLTDRRCVVVFKCIKICPTGNRWNRALFTWPKKTEFRLPLKLSLLRG